MITINLTDKNKNREEIEADIRKATKDILGIRYKYNKKGEFIAYANIFTTIVDIFKTIKRKML
ncbi:MAG: hypothetical protein JW866_00100 [Ignavibacteriales bacterium]|nr:hypothetical protein [Ignavibacteriales bacterium]